MLQSPENRRLIEEAAIKGVKALGIDWAATHAELRLTSRGPMLMEIGARLGGDYIATELVPRSTGIDMVEGAINLALGRVPDLTPRHKPRGAAIRYFTPPPGRVTNIIGLDKVHSMPGVKIVDLGIHVGDIVREFTSSLSRVGHVITEGATADQAIANAEAARDAVTFELEPIEKIHVAASAAGRVDKQIETVKRKKQKSILILAAGPLQIPAIIAAKRLGLRVVAADGNPMAPGLNMADKSYVIDILDKNECLKLVKKERIFASAHICSEVSLQVRGWLNDVMGMNGISLATAIRSTNKQKMREAFEAGGAPNPKWFAVQTVDEALAAADKIGQPIIFKPMRNSGKRGVTVLNGQVTQHDLIEAFNYALRESRDPGVIIEEFVEGPEFSVETLTWYGHTHIIAVTDKRTTARRTASRPGTASPPCCRMTSVSW